MAPYIFVAFVALAFPWLARAFVAQQRTPQFASAHQGASQRHLHLPANDVLPLKRSLAPTDLLVLAVLVVFAGTRAVSVGTDTSIYAVFFTRIEPNDWERSFEATPFEPGYTVLALLVKTFGGDFTALLVAVAVVTVGAAFWAVKRASQDVPLSIALYVLLAYYLTPMNLVRQGVAVSITFLAATFIVRSVSTRGLIAFIILIGLASSFHTTALFAGIGLIAVRSIRLSLRSAFWLLLAGAMAATALWASGWFSSLLTLLNPRYEIYSNIEAVGGLGTYLIIGFTVSLTFYALRLKPLPPDQAFATFAFVGCFALIMGTQSIYAVRLADYFTIFLVVLLPNAMRSKQVGTGPRFMLVLLCATYFVAYLANFGGLVPYESVFRL